MAEAVYLLCVAMSTGCAIVLMRMYARRRTPLLLWSSLCFVGLALNNLLLFVDLIILPQVDLSVARAATGAVATLLLVIGLIWSEE
ncbi:MAG TPA: DUF5985 family protein [Vicinamibacterales bacterium]|nr:DUF5985 family protein [Vicinamibacterales bacterium]